MAQIRSSLRLQRFEIAVAALATVVVAIAALLVAVRLASVGLPSDCWAVVFGGTGAGSERVASCQDPVRQFLEINESEASRVIAAFAFLPLVVGLILGVPTVGREIETGSAPMVWALSASRASWLFWRLFAIGAVALALLAGLALASEILWVARAPSGVPNRFDDAGLHGPVVLAKGLAAFGLATLIGAVLGRMLPALITASCAVIAFIVLGLVLRGVLEGEASIEGGVALTGWLFDNIESVILLLTGAMALVLTLPVVNRRRVS